MIQFRLFLLLMTYCWNIVSNEQCSNSYCNYHGECQLVKWIPTCFCEIQFYSGTKCEFQTDHCHQSDVFAMCSYLGTARCLPYFGARYCDCNEGFYGERCHRWADDTYKSSLLPAVYFITIPTINRVYPLWIVYKEKFSTDEFIVSVENSNYSCKVDQFNKSSNLSSIMLLPKFPTKLEQNYFCRIQHAFSKLGRSQLDLQLMYKSQIRSQYKFPYNVIQDHRKHLRSSDFCSPNITMHYAGVCGPTQSDIGWFPVLHKTMRWTFMPTIRPCNLSASVSLAYSVSGVNQTTVFSGNDIAGRKDLTVTITENGKTGEVKCYYGEYEKFRSQFYDDLNRIPFYTFKYMSEYKWNDNLGAFVVDYFATVNSWSFQDYSKDHYECGYVDVPNNPSTSMTIKHLNKNDCTANRRYVIRLRDEVKYNKQLRIIFFNVDDNIHLSSITLECEKRYIYNEYSIRKLPETVSIVISPSMDVYDRSSWNWNDPLINYYNESNEFFHLSMSWSFNKESKEVLCSIANRDVYYRKKSPGVDLYWKWPIHGDTTIRCSTSLKDLNKRIYNFPDDILRQDDHKNIKIYIDEKYDFKLIDYKPFYIWWYPYRELTCQTKGVLFRDTFQIVPDCYIREFSESYPWQSWRPILLVLQMVFSNKGNFVSLCWIGYQPYLFDIKIPAVADFGIKTELRIQHWKYEEIEYSNIERDLFFFKETSTIGEVTMPSSWKTINDPLQAIQYVKKMFDGLIKDGLVSFRTLVEINDPLGVLFATQTIFGCYHHFMETPTLRFFNNKNFTDVYDELLEQAMEQISQLQLVLFSHVMAASSAASFIIWSAHKPLKTSVIRQTVFALTNVSQRLADQYLDPELLIRKSPDIGSSILQKQILYTFYFTLFPVLPKDNSTSLKNKTRKKGKNLYDNFNSNYDRLPAWAAKQQIYILDNEYGDYGMSVDAEDIELFDIVAHDNVILDTVILVIPGLMDHLARTSINVSNIHVTEGFRLIGNPRDYDPNSPLPILFVAFSRFAKASKFVDMMGNPNQIQIYLNIPKNQENGMISVNVFVPYENPFRWINRSKHHVPDCGFLHVVNAQLQPVAVKFNYTLVAQFPHEPYVGRSRVCRRKKELATSYLIEVENMTTYLIVEFEDPSTIDVLVTFETHVNCKRMRQNTSDHANFTNRNHIVLNKNKIQRHKKMFLNIISKGDVSEEYRFNLYVVDCKRWSFFEKDWVTVGQYTAYKKDESISCEGVTTVDTNSPFVLSATIETIKAIRMGDFAFDSITFIRNESTIIANALFIWIGICLGLFIIAAILDIKDGLKVTTHYLLDNYPDDEYQYFIILLTGDEPISGSSSYIGIKLYGTEANSRRHVLVGVDDNHKLSSNSPKVFILTTSVGLGKIRAIDVWSDYSGCAPAWYCEKIIIRDHHILREWVFTTQKWFSLAVENGKIHYILYQKIPKPQPLVSYPDFMSTHIWFGMLHRTFGVATPRKHNVLIVFSMILLPMYFIFFDIGDWTSSKSAPVDYFTYCMDDVLEMALKYLLISMLVNYVLLYIYRNTEPYGFNIYTSYYGMDLTLKQPKFRISFLSGVGVQCIHILILLWWSYEIFCMVQIFGYYTSWQWLASVVIVILFDLIIVETLHVVIRNFIWRKYFMRYDALLFWNSVIDRNFKSPTKDDIMTMGKYIKPYMYYPICRGVEKLLSQKDAIIQRFRSNLWDFVIYLALIITLMHVIECHYDGMDVYIGDTMKEIFINGNYSQSLSFKHIYTFEDFYSYLEKTFLYGIHWQYSGWFMAPTFKLLSFARMRQQRWTETRRICPQADFYAKENQSCIGDYFLHGLDAQSHYPGWINDMKEEYRLRQKIGYQYIEPINNSALVQGYFDYIPDGGFSVYLHQHREANKRIIKFLQKYTWIDHKTQTLVVDFTSINPSSNYLTTVKLIFEIVPSRVLIKSYQIQSLRLIFHKDDDQLGTLVNYCVLFIVVMTAVIIRFLQRAAAEMKFFFTNISTYLDLCLIACCIATLTIYSMKLSYMDYLDQILYGELRKYYLNFDIFLDVEDQLRTSLAFLVFFTFLRFAIVMNTLPQSYVHVAKLAISKSFMLVVLYFLSIMLLSYYTHMTINSKARPCHSWDECFLTINVLLLSFDNRFRNIPGTNALWLVIAILRTIFIFLFMGIIMSCVTKIKMNESCYINYTIFHFIKESILRIKDRTLNDELEEATNNALVMHKIRKIEIAYDLKNLKKQQEDHDIVSEVTTSA